MPEWLAIVIAVIGALGGSSGLAALLSLRHQRRASDADAAARLTDAATALVADLRTDIEFLRRQEQTTQKKVRVLEQENRELRETLDHAITRLTMLERENEQLRQRISELEQENSLLRKGNAK